MARKNRIILFGGLITLAAALLAYGWFIHSYIVLLPEGADFPIMSKSESMLILDVTIAGVVRDDLGSLRQTYTDINKAAASCPT
jgi:hypothetical protein